MATPKEIKIIKILEVSWLVIMVASIIFGVYETAVSGIGESYLFFVFTLIAAIFYRMRRRQRERLESESEDK